jgi:hypothetical protein
MPTYSQDLASGEQALAMIARFANDICNKPDLRGNSRSVEVQGKAKAEVSRLVKQLADLNIEGAAKFGNTEYDGLLQTDLLPALQESTKCKERIFDDLKDRFLPKADNSNAPIKGTVIIRDGFRAYEQSGFQFSTLRIVAWDSKVADVLAVKAPEWQATGFFLPYDAESYKNPDLDRNATAGIQKIDGSRLEDIRDCPSSGYQHHWFQAQLNAIYCIRTRGGKSYAAIRVDTIDDDRIGFDFLFQPNGTTSF